MNLAFRDEVPPIPTNARPRFQMSPRLLLFGAIGLVAVILSILMLSVSSGNNPTTQMQRLSARLDALQGIIKLSKDSVSDPELNKLNSDLSILTTGSIARLTPAMTAAGMGGVGDDIKKAEADTATITTLENAKLTGVFDRTYATTLKQKLDTLLVLMKEIFSKTNSKQLQNELDATYKDFLSIRKQIDEKVNI